MGPDHTQALLVLTTLPNEQEARGLVRRLVEDRVVACGTVLANVTSVYRWEGRLEEASEAQVILKTASSRWDDVRTAVVEHHPYDVPELLALPIASGLDAYLGWIASETTAEG